MPLKLEINLVIGIRTVIQQTAYLPLTYNFAEMHFQIKEVHLFVLSL